MYHSIKKEDVLRHLKSSVTGISSEEAEKRLSVYGRNEIAGKRKKSLIK